MGPPSGETPSEGDQPPLVTSLDEAPVGSVEDPGHGMPGGKQPPMETPLVEAPEVSGADRNASVPGGERQPTDAPLAEAPEVSGDPTSPPVSPQEAPKRSTADQERGAHRGAKPPKGTSGGGGKGEDKGKTAKLARPPPTPQGKGAATAVGPGGKGHAAAAAGGGGGKGQGLWSGKPPGAADGDGGPRRRRGADRRSGNPAQDGGWPPHAVSGGQGGKKGDGRGAARYMPSPSSQPYAAQDTGSLLGLLAQVAPQARIREKESQLSSQESHFGGQNTQGWRPDSWHADNYAQGWNGESGGWQPTVRAVRNSRSEAAHEDDLQFKDRWRVQDDEDLQFMEKWNGLFSKGSPLYDGSATDPFKDDLRRRRGEACIWKKTSERKGHRKRYQERRSSREAHTDVSESSAWSPQERVDANAANEAAADTEMGVVFDVANSAIAEE